jgi:hypothetical protein
MEHDLEFRHLGLIFGIWKYLVVLLFVKRHCIEEAILNQNLKQAGICNLNQTKL